MSQKTETKPVPGRYSRQVLFSGIGIAGQTKIIASRVAIVGCGALGSVQAELLVRAGVGNLRIIDRDFVEESNLQRQILFDEGDVRGLMPKAVAAEKKLRLVNSLVSIEGIVEDVNTASIERLLQGVDLIMDATDNFETRYLVNDYAVCSRIPWIYGACVGSYGLTFPILPGETACLRCVFENAPLPGVSPTCDTAGVIGPIAALVAAMQVAEALKILSEQLDCTARKLTTVDLWENRHDTIDLPAPHVDCPCCGRRQFSYLEGADISDITTICGRNSVQIASRVKGEIDLDGLARRLEPLGAVEKTRYLVRVSLDNYQLTVFPDGRVIVSGTRDPAMAKSLYARYVGM